MVLSWLYKFPPFRPVASPGRDDVVFSAEASSWLRWRQNPPRNGI